MVDENLVRKIAQLARLELAENEVKDFVPQLRSILASFEQLERVNTEGVEPLITPTEMAFEARPDETYEHTGEAKSYLAAAPEKVGNLFKVPPVV